MVEQIELAKENSDSIFLVEFKGCGKTIPLIKERMKNYEYSVIEKRGNGGGKEILQELKKQSIAPNLITVCGLYTNCCIADTVGELARNSKINIQVVEKACIATTRQMHHLGLKDMSSYKSVRII